MKINLLDKKFATFLDQYANWNGIKTIALSFDMDWAPEYMIQNVINIINHYNVNSTFFVTNKSEKITETFESQIEVASHLYVSPNSSQGDKLGVVLDKFRSWYPNKVIEGNRFHLLNQSYRDLVCMGRNGYSYDISALRFNTPYILPAFHKDLHMTLLSYFWEDGICENSDIPLSLSEINIDSPGIKVFNFHPMNIYINGHNSQARTNFLKKNIDLLNTPEEIASKFRKEGLGASNLIHELLDFCMSNNIKVVSVKEIVDNFTKNFLR